MKRLIDSYFDALAAWLDRATERMRQDKHSLYWRGYEDGMNDARDLYQQHTTKEPK